MFNRLLTTKDVQLATGLTRSGVHVHVKRGTLKATLIGHTLIIQPKDFQAFLKRYAAGEFKPGWPKKEAKKA